MTKRELDKFDPSATFPVGVPLTEIRAAIIAGSDAPCAPLPAPEPSRTWNATEGLWELDGVPIPPDPTRATLENYDQAVPDEPTLKGLLPPIGTPVPEVRAPPPPEMPAGPPWLWFSAAAVLLGLTAIAIAIAT